MKGLIGRVDFDYYCCDYCSNGDDVGACTLFDQKYRLEVIDEDVYCLDFKEKDEG